MGRRFPQSNFGTPKFDASLIRTGAEFPAAVENYVLRVRDFYDSRARWHRRFYRLSSIVVIFAGATLPLLAGLEYTYKPEVLGILGVAIAALTSLRAFYHWDQLWVMLRNTEIVITGEYLAWKGTAKEALNSTDPAVIDAQKQEALRLVRKIIEIRQDEAGSYFRALLDIHELESAAVGPVRKQYSRKASRLCS
jgi:Protein of unknown function (DUF4231)